MSSGRKVDLNGILAWINALVVLATVFAFTQVGGNEYMNGTTVVLAAVLGVQTQAALWIERRRRDPFVIVLAFILILYYSLRLLTLLLVGSSIVLDRFPYAPSDSNVALLFMIVANAFFYAGLYVVRGTGRVTVDVGTWRPSAPLRAMVFVAVAMALIYSRAILFDPNDTPRIVQLFFTFASQSVIFLMALAYYLVFRRRMSAGLARAFLALLIVEMIVHTLSGSRSAFVYALQNALIVLLAVHGSVALPRRLVVVGVAALPFAVALLVASFVISTTVGIFRASGQPVTPAAVIESATATATRIDRDDAVEAGLPLIFSRAGFFDYSAEVIAHRRQYASVINPAAYVRSVVDNLLSPGFDLFDQPKISNALKFVYADRGTPSKAASSEEYQSDQLGIYGELFVLFGYAALPVFFVGAFLIKRVYFSLRSENPFTLAIKRVVTLAIFVQIVNSFGFDWTIAEVVPFVAGLYIFRVFFAAGPAAARRPISLIADAGLSHG